MKKIHLIKLICVFPLLFFFSQHSSSQRTDTLYMNASWQICEKPFASYYRFGKIMIDTFWYYTGRVMDFYINDTLEMDGNYSPIGEKDGPFWFFYPDGTLKAKGQYSANRRTGIWEYYYRKGKLKFRINYENNESDFSVLDYIDTTGNSLTIDSTGVFEIPVSNENGMYVYRLKGETKNGKPVGTWRYYSFISSRNNDMMVMKEVYEKGEFKKGTSYSITGYTESYKQRRVLKAVPEYPKLRITESFAKDRTSFRDTKNDQDLVDYLVTRKVPEFDAEDTSFVQSYLNMLKTLNNPSVLRYFQEPDKIYKGEILFNLSDSGDIEEVEVSGNLSEKEKEYMSFFVKKFKNIHEILVENVGIDAYHKIYFYTVIFAEFFPKRYLYMVPEKTFLFAVLPYDKLKEAFKEKKKKKKKS